MTMLTVMTMFLIYPFTLSHKHRHHRHHRHTYSEMTLAVYYCSKQKQWYYEKHKIRMTQMTLMPLNLGYGIGISSKQRHKRHQRHYRHTRAARGSGDSPEMRLWISKRYASKTRLPPKNDSTQPRCPYKFVYAPEWITSDSLFQMRHNLNKEIHIERHPPDLKIFHKTFRVTHLPNSENPVL